MSSLNAPLVDHAHTSDADHLAHDPHQLGHTHTPPLDIHQQAREARTRSELRHASKDEPQTHSEPAVPREYTSCYLTTLTVIRITAAICLLTIAGVTIECIHQTVVHRPASPQPDFFTAVLALIFHFFTALVLVLALLHWQPLLTRLSLLSSYLFCGLSLCYLSVLVLSNATVEGRFDLWLVDVLRVVCGALFLIGVVLSVLGCIGGQRMEDRRRARMEYERRQREAMV